MKTRILLLVTGLSLCTVITNLRAQGTAFTYQGRLNDGANLSNGSYDLRFAIYDALTVGTQQGSLLTNSATAVSNGLFTVTLDFGNQFPGADRWLEIGVRTNGSGAFSTLTPRQKLTPTPYAITAENVVPGAGLSGTYGSAVTFSNAANQFAGSYSGNGTGLTNVNAATFGGLASSNFWQLGGNAGANPANGAFLGTVDNQPLELRAGGRRALRLEPNSAGAPNIVGGASVNAVGSGAVGATIGGGGATNYFGFFSYTNEIDADFGTIGGGIDNHIQTYAPYSTIGGGQGNLVQTNSNYSTIGGGLANAIQTNALFSSIGGGAGNVIWANGGYSTIAGGSFNRIEGDGVFLNGLYSVIGGGQNNWIQTNAYRSTIAGGSNNTVQAFADQAVIGGGSRNTIQRSARQSTVAGGFQNTILAQAQGATIGGGYSNTSSNYGTVGGGEFNINTGNAATIGGGFTNQTSADYATVAGGAGNRASGWYSSVGGGVGNSASGYSSTIAGGGAVTFFGTLGNYASGDYATVGGGVYNKSTTNFASVGGGGVNTASGFGAVVAGGGGIDNSFNGYPNTASGNWSVVGGGAINAATNDYATVAGGLGNLAGGVTTNISLGFNFNGFGLCIIGTNIVNINGFSFPVPLFGPCSNGNNCVYCLSTNYTPGVGATVSGGLLNLASCWAATVSGGESNVASGFAATVAGGYANLAAGSSSFAAGESAQANDDNSFVWSDGNAYSSSGRGSFCIRASGGLRLAESTSQYFGSRTRQMINLWGTSYGIGVQGFTTYFRCDGSSPGNNGFAWYQGGVHSDTVRDPGAGGVMLMYLNNSGLSVNGTFVSMSDRNVKTGIEPVDANAILEKVAALPIARWRYTNDLATPHIGPMAQDFQAAFNVGADDKHIATLDESGVALAAIQGLNQKLEDQRAENAELKQRLEALEKIIRNQKSN